MNNFYRDHKKVFDRLEGLLLKNTVLEKGLVLSCVVVVGTSLKNGVALSLVFAFLTFFTVLLTSFFPKRIPHSIRVIAAVLVAAILYVPAAMAIDAILPGVSYHLGVFLPLLITNSLIVWRSESRFHKEKKGAMMLDLLVHILGFVFVICAICIVRELWGNGTLWDIPVGLGITPVAGILLPFTGFILLGFFAAILHKYKSTAVSMDKDGFLDLSAETQEFGYQAFLAPSENAERTEEEEVLGG